MLQMAAQALKALEKLEETGYEAYLVGGCVRDFLAGRAPYDYDLATNALPHEVQEVFSAYRVISTGIHHGTVTVIIDERSLEITTYRREGNYTDSRHPDHVVFVKELHEDLSRRDFTINAMAWNPRKGLVDLFMGRHDLDAGIIRCVGNPDTRFQEDALRILRALRFAARFRFRIESKTEAALFRQKEGILRIATERITQELNRMICGQAAGAVILQYVEILAVAIPELLWIWAASGDKYCPVDDTLTSTAVAMDRTPSELTLRWAVLLHNLDLPACHVGGRDHKGETLPVGDPKIKGELADAILHRLRFDRATREGIVNLVRLCDMPLRKDRASVRRMLYQLTPEVFFQILEVKRAETLGRDENYHARGEEYDQLEALAKQILEEEGYLTLRDLAVTGRDLMSQGYHGPEIGLRLAQILDAVVEGKVANEKEALLNFGEEESV